MSIFLQIIGGIFLFVILSAGSVGLYLWLKWKKLKKYAALAETSFPSRIRLVPDVSPTWLDEAEAKKAVSAFRLMDFTGIGAFRIKEMNSVRLFGFVHPQEHILAAVYRHEIAGVWSDVCIEYENGENLTVSNAPMGSELDVRPNARKIIDKTLDEIRLVERIVKERIPGPCLSVSAEDFPGMFEKSYAEDMEWRSRRGGATKEEIRRVAENMDIRFDDRDIDEAYIRTLGQTMKTLNDACVRRFAETTSLSVEEWENIRDSVFAVHEKIPQDMLPEYLTAYLEFSDEDTEALKLLSDTALPIREMFDRINERLPQGLKSQKIGEVSEPVRADIYSAPEAKDA